MMPTIYAKWICEICMRFGNNLCKMCSFADFKRPKLGICTHLQKKHCSGEQNVSMVIELQNNAHNIRQMEFGDWPQIWK